MSHPAFRGRMPLMALAFLCVLTADRSAYADKAQTSYYFLVHEIKLAEGQPDEVRDFVRKEVTRAIAAHPRLLEAMPADAPDPDADPKGFAKYIAKHKIEPFRVDVEVVEYEQEVEDLDAPRRGKRLTVRMGVRIFGEALPKHTFGFTGEGSATIKMEVGKKVRGADHKTAHAEAASGAAAEALTMALTRLDEKKAQQKKGKRGKRAKK